MTHKHMFACTSMYIIWYELTRSPCIDKLASPPILPSKLYSLSPCCNRDMWHDHLQICIDSQPSSAQKHRKSQSSLKTTKDLTTYPCQIDSSRSHMNIHQIVHNSALYMTWKKPVKYQSGTTGWSANRWSFLFNFLTSFARNPRRGIIMPKAFQRQSPSPTTLLHDGDSRELFTWQLKTFDKFSSKHSIQFIFSQSKIQKHSLSSSKNRASY